MLIFRFKRINSVRKSYFMHKKNYVSKGIIWEDILKERRKWEENLRRKSSAIYCYLPCIIELYIWFAYNKPVKVMHAQFSEPRIKKLHPFVFIYVCMFMFMYRHVPEINTVTKIWLFHSFYQTKTKLYKCTAMNGRNIKKDKRYNYHV